MIDQHTVTHHIQKYILSKLIHSKVARFRDLRPPGVDSNLYSYHLKTLLKQGYVQKVKAGYGLGLIGLRYVDRVNAETVKVRQQPRIITMLVLTNKSRQILLQKRQKQPYIDTWTLPNGKLHIGDQSITLAAQREAYEKLNLRTDRLNHRGDCYIRVYHQEELLSSTLAHIFEVKVGSIEMNDSLQWVKLDQLSRLDLAPAVASIVGDTLDSVSYFFEEYNHYC